MTGFRPYLSATIPQRTEVKALPSMKADPSEKQRGTISVETV